MTSATDALHYTLLLSLVVLLTDDIVGNEALLEVACDSPNIRSMYDYNTLSAVALHNYSGFPIKLSFFVY